MKNMEMNQRFYEQWDLQIDPINQGDLCHEGK